MLINPVGFADLHVVMSKNELKGVITNFPEIKFQLAALTEESCPCTRELNVSI